MADKEREGPCCTAETGLQRLAEWIVATVPGEPSRSEGVVDTVIRIVDTARAGGTAPGAREVLGVPWIEEVRRALAAADAHPQWDRAEYVAGQLVDFVCKRETAAERRGRADGAPSCRVCGCTDLAACPGGCAWVGDPLLIGGLCSACAPVDSESIRELAHVEGLDGWAAAALVAMAWEEELAAYRHDTAGGLLLWRPVETLTVRDGLL